MRVKLWFKVIALALVYFLIPNTLHNVYPFDNNTISVHETLVPPNIFQPLVSEDIKITSQIEFELRAAIGLLRNGKTPDAINGFLTESYRMSPDDARKIEFLGIEKTPDGVIATFKFIGKDDAVFVIHCTSNNVRITKKESSQPSSQSSEPSYQQEQITMEYRDEEYLLMRAANYLKDYPVNIRIDLSMMLFETLSEKNIEMFALTIARHNSLGFNVYYMFENDIDGQTLNMLKEKIRALSIFPSINVDDLLSRIGTSHVGGKVIDVTLRNINLINEKQTSIGEREYLVALKDDSRLEGISIPNYTAAITIGLSLAVLRIAKDNAIESHNKESYRQERKRILKIFNAIYRRFRIIHGETDFTEDELEFMVTGASKTKLYYVLRYALPPIVKAPINTLDEYHNQMQLVRQSV